MAKQDIYESVTNAIIAAIENGQTGDKFKLPWDGEMLMPENVQSQNLYRGVNVVTLWAWSMKHGYSSAKWGTYKQWAEKGAQVKKGEKAIKIVFWKTIEIEPSADNEDGETRMYARWSSVFNADQVEGYVEESNAGEIKRVVQADEFIRSIVQIFAMVDSRRSIIEKRTISKSPALKISKPQKPAVHRIIIILRLCTS